MKSQSTCFRNLTLTCTLSVSLLGSLALGQVRTTPFPKVKWNAIDSAARKVYNENKVRGMSVVVGLGNQIVFSKGYGLATPRPDYANGDTIYRLASVSKPISSILTMILEDQGKINIDNTTRSYFSTLPSHHTHRLRHILTHQSGVRHYISGDPCSAQSEWFNQMSDASKLFWSDALLFTPGTDADYSTHAFTLLGGALEKTGRTYGQLLERQLAMPQQLPSLRVENRAKHDMKRSGLFRLNGNLITQITNPRDDSWKSPGGGLEASANDLCKLGMSLVAGKILKPATLDRMLTRQPLADGTLGSFGLGFRIANHLGEKVARHGGDGTGASTHWRIYPKSRVVVVVLNNTSDQDPAALASQIAEYVIKGVTIRTTSAETEYDPSSSLAMLVEEIF